MKCKTLQFLLIISFLFAAFSNSLFAKEKSEIGIDVGAFTGTSILKAYGNSWDKKDKPLIGLSFMPYATNNILNFYLELSYAYEFPSNYINYYYYPSLHSLELLQQIGLNIRFGRFDLMLNTGAGINFIFSKYKKGQNFIVSFGTGILLSNVSVKAGSLKHLKH